MRRQETVLARKLLGGAVIGRKPGQAIYLDLPDGSQVIVTALACARRRVRLHISAPPSVNIRRAELRERELKPIVAA